MHICTHTHTHTHNTILPLSLCLLQHCMVSPTSCFLWRRKLCCASTASGTCECESCSVTFVCYQYITATCTQSSMVIEGGWGHENVSLVLSLLVLHQFSLVRCSRRQGTSEHESCSVTFASGITLSSIVHCC